jgi:uncharacterized protein involved in exopolysaccharide biosynthesis
MISNFRIEPRQLLQILSKRKWLFIIPILVTVLATYASTYFIKSVYESSVTIYTGTGVLLSTELQKTMGEIRDALVGGPERELELAGLRKEITSTLYLLQLADKLKLSDDPKLTSQAASIAATRPEMTVEAIKAVLLVNSLQKAIRIDFIGRSFVKISVQSNEAVRARDLTAALGEVYIDEQVKKESRTMGSSSSFAYDQLSRFDRDIQIKTDEKTQLERESIQLRLDESVASESNRKEINAEIQATLMRIEDKKDEERQLVSRLSMVPNSRQEIDASPALDQMREEIRRVISGLSNSVLKFAWNTPSINSLKLKLLNLEQDLAKEFSKLAAVQFSDLDDPTRSALLQLLMAREQLSNFYLISDGLKLAILDLNSKVNQVPVYQTKIDQVSREIGNLREMRQKFQNQKEGYLVTQAVLDESKYRVIEPAGIPLKPIWPDTLKLIMMGVVVGLVLGTGAVLATELFDTSLKSIDDAEGFFGVSVLGTIPKIGALERQFPSN